MPKANIASVFSPVLHGGHRSEGRHRRQCAPPPPSRGLPGFRGAEKAMNGDDMMQLDDAALRKAVHDTNIFAHVPRGEAAHHQSLKTEEAWWP
ncbi:MAG: hypothetical protein IPL64_08410 [Flavobacteriales bacterium]|nr:hypothetical protein [Flavobacteriales bacterium]